MANTTNLNMVKPAGTDHALVAQINSNMDILDSAIGALPSGKTIQGQINETNSNIVTSQVSVNSLSELKTYIETRAGTIQNGGMCNVAWYMNYSPTLPLMQAVYQGTLHKNGQGNVITVIAYSSSGTDIEINKIGDNDWYFNGLTGKLSKKVSSIFSNLLYREIDDIVEVTGTFTGNGTTTVNLGIPSCSGPVVIRNDTNGTMGVYYVHGGIADTWDGVGGRVFESNNAYTISAVLKMA